MVGGGQYYGYNANEPAPVYMVWDAKLEASYLQMDQIIQKLYMVSELSPAALGDLKQGLAESGSALKRLMMPTLAKVNRLRLRLDPALKEVLRITADLEVVGRGSASRFMEEMHEGKRIEETRGRRPSHLAISANPKGVQAQGNA